MFALAVLATLVTVALFASLLRERPGTPSERIGRRRRRDAREALNLLGNALAATHDPGALLPVVLKVTVEATGAEGGRLLDSGREVARIGGEPRGLPLRLTLPLSDRPGDGVVVLHPPKGGFAGETVELARWLVSQAAIAVENAALHDVVQRQATTDELTGLANRRRFMHALAAEVARGQRAGGGFALVLADIDDFKAINDQFGHYAGDAALRRFADLLGAELRDVDLGGRLGGEEFAALLPGADLPDARTAAERIRRAAAESRLVLRGGVRVRFTVSLGVARSGGGSARDVLQAADAALYRAKAAGKNRVAVTDAV